MPDLNSLSEALTPPTQTPSPNAGCGTGRWLHSLEPDVQALVRAALESDEWGHAPLARRLREALGLPTSIDVFARHRNGGCRCARVGLT